MAKEELKYEEALHQLEHVVTQMENNELGIDALSEQLKKAQKLIKLCKDKLTKTDNGIASIVSSKNRYAKALGVDIEDLSVNEVLNLIMETPRILKSPILVDEKRLQVGYKEDDIRAFLPRSVRNVENAEARLRAAL